MTFFTVYFINTSGQHIYKTVRNLSTEKEGCVGFYVQLGAAVEICPIYCMYGQGDNSGQF